MKRTIGGLAAILVAAAAALTPSTASAADFTIDLYTVVRDKPGTETSLGTWDVPAAIQGRDCTATSTPENNSSIHPGNNLQIVSATTVTLANVEGDASPDVSVNPIVLGSSVEVILVMGPKGTFSAGLFVSFDCPPPPTTTTTTVPIVVTPSPMSATPPTCDAPGEVHVPEQTVGYIWVEQTDGTWLADPDDGYVFPDGFDPTFDPGDLSQLEGDECGTVTTTSVAVTTPPTVPSSTVAPLSPPVRVTTIAPPTTAAPSLPRTGSSELFVLLGFGALLLGGIAVLGTRRPV